MAKQTGKGRQRRAGALERKAMQHHDFIGETDPERAEAEFRKHERLQDEENREIVHEMAAELNDLASSESAPQAGMQLAQQVFHVATAAAGVLLVPARIGLRLAREVMRLPFTVVTVLREREA